MFLSFAVSDSRHWVHVICRKIHKILVSYLGPNKQMRIKWSSVIFIHTVEPGFLKVQKDTFDTSTALCVRSHYPKIPWRSGRERYRHQLTARSWWSLVGLAQLNKFRELYFVSKMKFQWATIATWLAGLMMISNSIAWQKPVNLRGSIFSSQAGEFGHSAQVYIIQRQTIFFFLAKTDSEARMLTTSHKYRLKARLKTQRVSFPTFSVRRP